MHAHNTSYIQSDHVIMIVLRKEYNNTQTLFSDTRPRPMWFTRGFIIMFLWLLAVPIQSGGSITPSPNWGSVTPLPWSLVMSSARQHVFQLNLSSIKQAPANSSILTLILFLFLHHPPLLANSYLPSPWFYPYSFVQSPYEQTNTSSLIYPHIFQSYPFPLPHPIYLPLCLYNTHQPLENSLILPPPLSNPTPTPPIYPHFFPIPIHTLGVPCVVCPVLPDHHIDLHVEVGGDHPDWTTPSITATTLDNTRQCSNTMRDTHTRIHTR